MHIWDVFLQIGFFITPVIYSIEIIPKKYLSMYLLNPLANIIIGARNSALYAQYPEGIAILITIMLSVLVLITGYILFKHRSKYLAEEL
jgi:lipopolysaccharide transport system permease protein